MPDLLTHVLITYSILTLASWRIHGLRRFVSIGMVGSVLPDLVKIHLLVHHDLVTSVLGIPFAWKPIHTLGGALVLSGIGAVLFPKAYRRRAYGCLLVGAGTGLLLDTGLIRANNLVPPYFYPFSWWQLPAGNLYLSSELWPTLIAIGVAGTVWILDRTDYDVGR